MEPDDYTLDLTSIDGSTISISMPQSTNVGDVWLDTSTMTTNVYSTNNDWINIGDLTEDTINLRKIDITPVEFEDTMPDVAKVEDMCNDYPGLRKAYENFKAVYKMVHQDWQGRQDAENESPF